MAARDKSTVAWINSGGGFKLHLLINDRPPECPTNFLTRIIAGLSAYNKQPKKPSLRFDDFNQMPALLSG